MEKLLLTPNEAAKALSISRSKLYELIGQGRLSTVKRALGNRQIVGLEVSQRDRIEVELVDQQKTRR